MAFRHWLQRLLGSGGPQAADKPPLVAWTPPVPARPAVERPAASPLTVRRDEVIDGRSRIAGYQFTVRRLDIDQAPAPAEIVAALCAENLGAFAGRRLAIVPLTVSDWQRADFRPLIAAHTAFLVAAPAAGAAAADWLATLREIRAAGGGVALDDAGAALPGALALAGLVVLDFRAYEVEGFEQRLRRLQQQHPEIALAADGVSAWSEHRLGLSLGLRYSLGGFAAEADAEDQSERLGQSRLVLIEMLNLLRREAESAEIAAVAKRDPGIAMKILGMANSPASGLASPVASLEQAMLVLGRTTIYRWLSVAMFRSGNGRGRDEALLERALWRARFLERVAAGRRPQQECDELFLVGLLSLINYLLGVPMVQVVRRLNLPEQVAAALLHSAGSYGRFLLLARVLEKGYDGHALKLAGSLGIPPAGAEAAAREARLWAEETLAAG